MLQVIIVQWGGEVMKTKALDWDEWLYCLLFGAFSLVWNQVRSLLYSRQDNTLRRQIIASIPSKSFRDVLAGEEKERLEPTPIVGESTNARPNDAHYLWLRSISRVTTQVPFH